MHCVQVVKQGALLEVEGGGGEGGGGGREVVVWRVAEFLQIMTDLLLQMQPVSQLLLLQPVSRLLKVCLDFYQCNLCLDK